MKFAQQKWRKSLEKWSMMVLRFFFKATASALEVNLCPFIQILFLQINPYVCSVQ